ncbi:hypothetical protein SPI_00692 [Niveomyces insectorum RCEF 264]|uniref:protein-histidine N-methyltransferase n=1 Tax=Niveomyces insectorum RCEF 264 TaxID=1081102 RepID=A0A168AAY9_9HYPO|nr:hypothetical protein SPI_00692 [Niveomyces insectorum RCEF 264]
MATFSFAFSGDDIEGSENGGNGSLASAQAPSAAQQTAAPAASAFPVQGKPQLPPQRHDVQDMLARLPSKIAFSLLDVRLDDEAGGNSAGGGTASSPGTVLLHLPRRELWDVKVQLMAEEDTDADADAEANADHEQRGQRSGGNELAPGLGTHDVKTGIYEGGFKSWESSVDLVKALLQPSAAGTSSVAAPSAVAAAVLLQDGPARVIELGCGTALPSLALFHWACATAPHSHPLSITVADYNPGVLYLVTLPNFLLAWALQMRATSPLLQQAVSVEQDEGHGDVHGEVELTDDVKAAFVAFLDAASISLTFVSGGWSPAFIDLLYAVEDDAAGADAGAQARSTTAVAHTLVLGAETIYSPFALEAFSETLLAILRREPSHNQARQGSVATAVIGAKKLYFGVGGSLDDFIDRMRAAGATVRALREETDGVRRGVVQCLL